MKPTRTHTTKFSGAGLIIGFACVLPLVFLVSYFLDPENLQHKSSVIREGNYSESDIAGWHTIDVSIFNIQAPKK